MENSLPNNNEFILTACTYFVGTDIAPGRYSVKLISGSQGNLNINKKYHVHEWFGTEKHCIKSYDNVRLELGAKITIIGDIKLLFTKQKSFNIDEDVSIIEEQQKEIDKLKSQIKELKALLDSSAITTSLPDNYTLSFGFYYGGQTIKTGIYDMQLISGTGYIIVGGHHYRMGTGINEKTLIRGIKINLKTKIEITDSLIIGATLMA